MFGNLKIGSKIAFLVVAISCVTIAVSLYASKLLSHADKEYSKILTTDSAAAVSTVRVSRDIGRIGYALYRVMVYPEGSSEAKVAVEDVRTNMAEALHLLSKTLELVPEFTDKLSEISSALTAMKPEIDEAIHLAIASDRDGATAILIKVDLKLHDLAARMKLQTDAIFKGMEEESISIAARSLTAKWTMLIGSILAAIFGVIVSLTISRKAITGPLNRLREAMEQLAGGRLDIAIEGQARRDEVGLMAKTVQVFKNAANENKRLEVEAASAREAEANQRDRQSAIDNAKAEDLKAFVHAVEAGFDALSIGDLTARMNQAVAPEFEPIRAKFNASVETLETAIGAVVGAVAAIRSGLNEISVASNDLAQRTEQQAASLEETVAALGTVTVAVNDTAVSAGQAQGSATTAQKNAERGGEIVDRAVAAMAEIEKSSDQIGKIIGVIDEIAFQTNLLALNAGVEAARAGEAGRGFAVVAQEVRSLAQRSAEAAKEIKNLIATSSAQVSQGVELVTASGRSLEEIVGQVSAMASVVSGIATSAREQAVSLREVSGAADQMDKVTQQNAAMVEETTAAAQNLSTETEELAAMVERFKTKAVVSGRQSTARLIKHLRPTAVVSRPVPQMRNQGAAGAVAKAAPFDDTWEEF